MMTAERQSKNVTRSSFDEAEKFAAKDVAKMEDAIDVIPVASSAVQLEVESAFQMLKKATREYCFVKVASCNELEDVHELETGFSL